MDEQRQNSAGQFSKAQDLVPEPEVTLRLSNFSVSAGGRALLQRTDASFPAGRLTLILGCSGVGKSVLLRILAGLIDSQHPSIRYSGRIDFELSGAAGAGVAAGAAQQIGRAHV